jgi:protein-S-isoprenylcysteine O-methyltransferase Ste14
VRKVVPPVYLLGALILMACLHRWLPLAQLIDPPVSYIGAAVIAGGLAVIIWAAALFKKAGTPIKPFEPTTALVLAGPYEWTRNPMYLGMVLTLAGAGLLLGSLSPFLMVALFTIFIDTQFIRHEERLLATTLGEPYRAYLAIVRRWL